MVGVAVVVISKSNTKGVLTFVNSVVAAPLSTVLRYPHASPFVVFVDVSCKEEREVGRARGLVVVFGLQNGRSRSLKRGRQRGRGGWCYDCKNVYRGA